MSTFLPPLRPLVLVPVISSPADGAWPMHDGAWMEAVRPLDRVDADAVGDCVVVQSGVLIAAIGNPRGPSGFWSSTVRTFLTVLALILEARGQLDLDAFIGVPFPSWVKWRHVLARVSTPPSREDHLIWRYSGGDDWPWLHRKLEAVGGADLDVLLRTLLLDPIGADLTPNWEHDGDPAEGKPDRGPAFRTIRVDGSPYEMAKFGLLMQRDGVWNGQRLFDADLWRMATSGGLNGDGHPDSMEGWNAHLIRNGRYDELGGRPLMGTLNGYFGAGGVNRGYVVVLPEKDLVVARVRRSGVYLDQFLPGLLSALDL